MRSFGERLWEVFYELRWFIGVFFWGDCFLFFCGSYKVGKFSLVFSCWFCCVFSSLLLGVKGGAFSWGEFF